MNDTKFKCTFISDKAEEKEVVFLCNSFEKNYAKDAQDRVIFFEYIKNPKDESGLDKLWDALNEKCSDVRFIMYTSEGEEFEVFYIPEITEVNMGLVPSTVPEQTREGYNFMKTLRIC